MTGTDPHAPGNEPNRSGGIHLHPTATTMVVQIKNGFSISTVTVLGGAPSSEDHKQHNLDVKHGRTKDGVRSILVDSKNIYLYNGNNVSFPNLRPIKVRVNL